MTVASQNQFHNQSHDSSTNSFQPLKNLKFGTDGIRGKFGIFPIDQETIIYLAQALTEWLRQLHQQPTLLIAADTRESSEKILHCLSTGIHQKNGKITYAGILPTPALAYLTSQSNQSNQSNQSKNLPIKAHLGIMITASHNPWQDNGLKFFSPNGGKFSLEEEQQLENFIRNFTPDQQLETTTKKIPTTDFTYPNADKYYQQHLLQHFNQQINQQLHSTGNELNDKTNDTIKDTSSLPLLPLSVKTKLNELTLIVDCANGATHSSMSTLLSTLGIQNISIASTPNGKNINHHCGATVPENLIPHIQKHQADFGVSFDGDGDRIILVADDGTIIDGDSIIYLLAKDFAPKGFGIVGTQMTNLAIENYLKQQQIPFIRTPVGDKYVLQKLLEKNWHLGTEPSGHILLPQHAVTGDGILVFLVILAKILNTGKTLSQLIENYTPYPQLLKNYPTTKQLSPTTQQAIDEIIQQHPEQRILVRPSGTEPKIRIMVEGKNAQQNESICNQIIKLLQTEN